MQTLTVNKFQSGLAHSIKQVLTTHEPLRITQTPGEDVVMVSAADWDELQETLYILQNHSLMQQISESLKTHKAGTGYSPTQEELHEIVSV